MARSVGNEPPAHTIGVLCLEVPLDEFAGSLSDPTIFDVPVLYETVRSAWVSTILDADPKLAQPAIDAAHRLVDRGATNLISNCGFFIQYKAAIE